VLTAERHTVLLQRLGRDGRLVVGDLARELDLSEDTVRRDLRDLAAAGLVQRVHGGALPASPAMAAYPARESIGIDGKHAIARLAAEFIVPGSTVILDGGTTALALAQALPPDLEVTVVTHSPTIAVALASHPRAEVLVLGGRLFKHSVVSCGALTLEAIQGVHADACFIGVTGVHAEAGLTTGDPEEAAVKRALARSSADVYMLASAEKIGAVSPHRVLPLGEVTAVLTDAAPASAGVRSLRRAQVDVRSTGVRR
jgi:DeoR/GlpR family transcriptional regulator of sugar metabolism